MKRKDIMVIIVPMLIFVIIWISSSIYHSYVTSTIPETVSEHIDPIEPSFDINTIEKIKSREVINVSAEQTPIVNNPTTSAALSPTPAPSLTETENQASLGGSLNP